MINDSSPTPGSGSGSGSNGSAGGNVNVYIDNKKLGTDVDGGIEMTVKINGKETKVVLGLDSFTYDYETPEIVTVTTGFKLRKGPDGAYGSIKSVKKGQQITIIGRDKEWLIVDLGDGKTGYILEGMTKKLS